MPHEPIPNRMVEELVPQAIGGMVGLAVTRCGVTTVRCSREQMVAALAPAYVVYHGRELVSPGGGAS